MTLSETGLEIKTQPEILAELEDAVDGAIPGVNLRAGPVQQIVGALSEQLAIVWERLQAVYAGSYPDSADGLLLAQLAALTGTVPRGATRSTVVGTVTLGAGATLSAGAVAAVAGDPDAQFRTTEDVTNAEGTTENVDVTFESVATGPVAAPSASLTVIVTPRAGWDAVTNTLAAELGRDEATTEELRVQRVVELAGGGRGTLPAIRAAVAAIDEVLEVDVAENTTMTVSGTGRPPKSVEVVVWDGDAPAADDDEIAQAIWDARPAGIEVHGVADSGTAIDEAGDEQTVAFTRASVVAPTVYAAVILAAGTGGDWEAQATAAIVAHGATYSVGQTAYASQFICALLEVPGIVAVDSLTLSGGGSVLVAYAGIIRVAAEDVTVEEAV